MSALFDVKLRMVKYGDIILPDDHNSKVEALKELIAVSKDTVIYMITGTRT